MNKENEIIEKMIQKYNLDLGNDYIYVGATIIKRSDFPQSTEIFYCEDGFNDEEGIPYIMQSIVPKGIFNRDRMIVFYTKNLQRRMRKLCKTPCNFCRNMLECISMIAIDMR